MTTWVIKDWGQKFSNADSVKRVTWRWLPLPINLLGERYRTLMDTSKGREAFAVFVSLCEVAANLPERGVLADERGPLKPSTISVKTGIPERIVSQAISTLSDPSIGWLVEKPPSNARNEVSSPSQSVTNTDAGRTASVPAEQSRAEPDQTKPDSGIPRRGREAPPTGVSSNGAALRACGTVVGMTTRECLESLGVGEPALSQLTGCPKVVPAWLLEEWETIRRRHEAGKIRDPLDVLVSAAAKLGGIKLTRASIAPDLAEQSETLRKLREKHRAGAGT